jgi:hypothetical protein
MKELEAIDLAVQLKQLEDYSILAERLIRKIGTMIHLEFRVVFGVACVLAWSARLENAMWWRGLCSFSTTACCTMAYCRWWCDGIHRTTKPPRNNRPCGDTPSHTFKRSFLTGRSTRVSRT